MGAISACTVVIAHPIAGRRVMCVLSVSNWDSHRSPNVHQASLVKFNFKAISRGLLPFHKWLNCTNLAIPFYTRWYDCVLAWTFLKVSIVRVCLFSFWVVAERASNDWELKTGISFFLKLDNGTTLIYSNEQWFIKISNAISCSVVQQRGFHNHKHELLPTTIK